MPLNWNMIWSWLWTNLNWTNPVKILRQICFSGYLTERKKKVPELSLTLCEISTPRSTSFSCCRILVIYPGYSSNLWLFNLGSRIAAWIRRLNELGERGTNSYCLCSDIQGFPCFVKDDHNIFTWRFRSSFLFYYH